MEVIAIALVIKAHYSKGTTSPVRSKRSGKFSLKSVERIPVLINVLFAAAVIFLPWSTTVFVKASGRPVLVTD